MQPETQKILEVMVSIGAEVATRDCGQRILLRALDALALINGAIQEEPPSLDIGPSIDDVISGVCRQLHISPTDILSPCRTQRVAHARMICFFLCRKLTGRSFPEIGAAFKRDHSTVIHGVKSIERRTLNAKYARTLAVLERSLRPSVELAAA